jgi:DNA-binding HxlR family transcriptional regulator
MITTEADPNRKSYGQVCPMATGLDYVGDRWTILILRELLGGPARFHEIKHGLPGIANNLLTERLRRLEDDDLVRRSRSGSTVLYGLTDRGAGIRDMLEALAYWGATLGRVGPVLHQRSIRAVAVVLQAILVRAGDRLPADRVTIELEVDGEVAEIVLDPKPTVTVRPSIGSDARVRISAAGMSAFLAGRPSDDATFTHVSGDEAATESLLTALGGTG